MAMPRAVRIVPYDPQWPNDYDVEQRRIVDAIGDAIVSLDHIGSTAVPGLGGKPIVDIMSGVRNLGDAERCLHRLSEIGYTEVTPEPQEPDWHFCLSKRVATPRPRLLNVHLHLVNHGSAHWEKHLRFRDYLRAHPSVAHEYFDLKLRLASLHGSDREGYTNAKSAFIDAVVVKARQLR
jgi:GrpB-like predicted nucleotidyltransferase (UPF0157 family)